jgi:hypothetical protein
VSVRQRAGWALIALAGVISSTIVAIEINALISSSSPESSETLPIIGFEPLDE